MNENAYPRIEETPASGSAAWSAAKAQILRRPYLFPLMVYALSVLIRIPLVFSAGELPFIFNDEMRYMHIAKSLLSQQVLIRNQPVVYRYILYPLLLSPLYLLPEGINVFRTMQIVNVFLMHSMIFPIYAAGVKVTRDRRSALLIAILSLLLPDTVLTKNIMTESLTYPMVFLTFLFLIEMVENPEKTLYWIRSGVFCFLLYAIKPVYALLGAACFFSVGLYALLGKDRRMLGKLIWFAGAIAVCLLLFLGLLKALNMDPLGKTHYDAQTQSFTLDHLLLTLKGMLIYTHYHLIAFFVLPPIVLISIWRKAETKERMLVLTILLSLVLFWLCTVYVIYVDEVVSNGPPLRVHVRYTAVFFPIMLMYLFSASAKNLDIRKAGIACLAFLAVGLAYYDTSAFESARVYAVDSMMLSLLHLKSGAWNGIEMYLPALLAVLLPISALAVSKGYVKRIRAAMIAVIIAGLCLNQYASYARDSNSYQDGYLDDAKEMVLATGKDAWMVCPSGQEEWAKSVAIDIQSRCEIPVVTFESLLAQTRADGSIDEVLPSPMGTYVNSVPTYSYPLGKYMIFDTSLLAYTAVYNSAQGIYSSDQLYAYIPVSSGQPWLHSLVYGLNEGWVQEGSRFLLYDSALVSGGRIRLYLKVRAGVPAATLTLYTQDGQTFSFTPGNSLTWVEAEFDTAAGGPFAVYMQSSEGNIYVDTYQVADAAEAAAAG